MNTTPIVLELDSKLNFLSGGCHSLSPGTVRSDDSESQQLTKSEFDDKIFHPGGKHEKGNSS